MNRNTQEKNELKNFIIDNKREKIQEKLYFNGIERTQIINSGIQGKNFFLI